MDNRDAIAMISGNLEAAKLRKQDAIEQMLAATHEVAQLECALRNAQRRTNDTRPRENVGDPNCIPHDWHADPDNMQYYCPCSARFDVDMSELGTLLADVFPASPQFVGLVQSVKPMSIEEFTQIVRDVEGSSAVPVSVSIPESDGKFEGSLMTAFLSATPPAEPANKWAEQG